MFTECRATLLCVGVDFHCVSICMHMVCREKVRAHAQQHAQLEVECAREQMRREEKRRAA